MVVTGALPAVKVGREWMVRPADHRSWWRRVFR